MGEYNSLEEIAKEIKNSNKKVSLLYAFNGTGKTRLSVEFKKLATEKINEEIIKHIIYYNAFTEDLFTWDNDLENDSERKLKINKNSKFIDLVERQGKEIEIANKFKKLTSSKIEPKIDIKTGEVSFSLPTGDESSIDNIKISRGEESIFIWSIFYVLLESIIEELNIDEINDRSTDEFNHINYIFIDDPISSLDDNNAIDIAIELKELILNSKNENLQFIISTHHALFYNVLYNEIKNNRNIKDNKKKFYFFKRMEDKYLLENINDSPFGYHLIIKEEIKKAIESNKIEKYHFVLFRNLLEKTATYLGYRNWGDLLIGDMISGDSKQGYIRRINLFSHSKHSELEYKELSQPEKNMLKLLFNNFIQEFKWEM